ncbi:Thiol-disulfide isomerase or thioredoxin [Mucilaginibacter mallensis]|uniref:Thiol-disulfide isomerase or thioredoxin n=1 Tax=Mucilaginibacter mallensis TaxID=652787 RepID=A0A1H2C4S3_MUCMA|nr:TlpA disulfide reductase family protein [Mucilaginibacter mallensis]SDT65257.1 Thiol-disulfide isomerase or thioredoxin [Mucilaginibacter mallensis]
MKKFALVFTVLLLIFKTASAQNATLQVTLTNSTATSYHIWLPDVALNYDYLKKGTFDVPLSGSKPVLYVFKLTGPQFAYIMCNNSDANNAKRINYIMYLSPGDNISFKADFKGKDNGITVTGKGSKNNQPLLSALDEGNVQSLYGDTLPNRIIAFVNSYEANFKTSLDKYVALYKPSDDFIKNEKINIKYDAVYRYFDFKENNKYDIQPAYARNESKWKAIQDSLFNTIKLNNDDALTSISYAMLLRTFLGREKERLWRECYENPETFYKQWYNTDVTTGKKLFDDDEQNLLQEKVINHYFTNRSAEYLYALLFDKALGEHNPKNIVAIFDGFKQKYPQSKYINWFGPAIDTIRQIEKRVLSADMVFVANNGTRLNTMEELLALAKGKTVLLDMWGTWCGPCRNEIHDNGPAIKAYFKGKGLDYFYVANRDLEHEVEWKKLIAYFDMKGTHILANDALSNDIMTKVKSGGFPTYIIIKKDGTYELSKSGYPMNRDVLIKQLEAALAQ